ncbi:Hsp70 family protein [Lachnospiraceae bacterium C1.1]|nr:Hsp70 family protein [Lachnospiraceae bacterium C1.1]
MAIYLGIDFGTSTIYVTRWNENDGSVTEVSYLDPMTYNEGKVVFPNVIYYGQNGSKLVGKAALKCASIDPRNGVLGVKRKFVGDNWEYYIPALNANYSPVDVATDIFTYIKDKVSEKNGGANIDGVVISVPYAYGNKERMKIRRSAERAGLNVMDLIEEPVAAAISYGLFQKSSTMGHSEKIMVFDFGGGTLDITIFSYEKSTDGQVSIEVLNTEGIKDFGGQYIDDILMNKVAAKAGIIINEINDENQRLLFQIDMNGRIVQMKEESLYWEEDYEEDFDGNISGIPIETTVCNEEIEAWLRGERVLEKIRDSVDDALCNCGDKGLDPEDIDKVLLVGGSSNMLIVKKTLKMIFGKEPKECNDIEINKMVGNGAGIYCGMKVRNSNRIKIIQKLSYSIGVRIGANFDKLIEKNQRYGLFSKPRSYALTESKDNRDIEVYQGNSKDITKCFLIGKIPVSNLVLGENRNIEIALGTTTSGMVAYKVYSNGECYEGVLE